MDKFLVPQYLDVEPKIIGPITLRQFTEMLGCCGLDFVFYKAFYFTTFILLALANTALFLIIAFFKINGMPFHFFVLNLVQTLKKPSLRVWKKLVISALPPEAKPEVSTYITPKKAIPESKLSDLSLMVDTGGAYNISEEEMKNNNGK